MLPRALSYLLPIAAVLVIACACTGGPHQRLVFTPVPYTDVGTWPDCPQLCSPYVAAHDSGGEYFADQVLLQIDADKVESTTRFAESLGFRILVTDTLSVKDFGFATMLVQVPPGAASAAVELFKKRFGVRSAGLNDILHTQSAD